MENGLYIERGPGNELSWQNLIWSIQAQSDVSVKSLVPLEMKYQIWKKISFITYMKKECKIYFHLFWLCEGHRWILIDFKHAVIGDPVLPFNSQW